MKFFSAYFLRTTILLCCLFIISEELQSQNWSGPVGIGTTQPRDLLHVQDGSIMLEGSNQYINFVTKPPSKTGLRFLNGDGQVNGTWSYNSGDETANLSSNDRVLGLIYDFRNDFALLGRTDQIGENEKFGLSINAPKPEFGGMNIEMSGHDDHKPYYGYATQGKQQAFHYYDGASKSWKLRIGKDIMAVTSDGFVGIGTNSPVSRLHIHGSNSNLNTDEGLLTVGGSTNRIALGITSTGLSQIYSKTKSNLLVLGGGENDVLAVDGTNRRVGIGMNNPGSTLDVKSLEQVAIKVVNNSNSSLGKYGARFEATSEGGGIKYGIHATARAGNLATTQIVGGNFLGVGGHSIGDVYGIYSSASGWGDGNHFGIYTKASSDDPAPNRKSWALYSDGNSYFSEKVFIGDKNGATGYKLSVDGKIICEDLKMESSGSWPDYVFEKNYDLKPLKEVEAFVKENNHLPGIPSAQEIEDQGGYEQGTMNRILLEKVEELTLYLIEQKKELEKQNEKIAALEKALKSQSEE